MQNDPRQPGNSDLWIVDLASGTSTRITFDPGPDTQPVWSPDGRYIAWQAIRGDKPDIYRRSADGSGWRTTSAPTEANNLTDWTHSGHLIFTMGGDVYAMPVNPDAAGTRTPVPVVQSPAGELGRTSPRTIVGLPTCRTRPGDRKSSSSHLPPVETR